MTPSTGGTAYNLKLVIPSTGLEEFFSLYVPALPPGVERPMVVGFHSFRRSHLEVSLGTDMLAKAAARNWFFLAPVQRSAVGDPFINYGSVQSQEHVEVLIRWVMDIYEIDPDRIYGVGFSMGGGSVMSYAARHCDGDEGPSRPSRITQVRSACPTCGTSIRSCVRISSSSSVERLPRFPSSTSAARPSNSIRAEL